MELNVGADLGRLKLTVLLGSPNAAELLAKLLTMGGGTIPPNPAKGFVVDWATEVPKPAKGFADEIAGSFIELLPALGLQHDELETPKSRGRSFK